LETASGGTSGADPKTLAINDGARDADAGGSIGPSDGKGISPCALPREAAWALCRACDWVENVWA
jgi:hypothetical protein